MNIEQFTKSVEDANVTATVLELAGVSVEQFCDVIDAASQKQRDFANDLKIRTVAACWRHNIKQEFHNEKFAKALIATVMQKRDARFWCDNELTWRGQTPMRLLKEDFKQNLGK